MAITLADSELYRILQAWAQKWSPPNLELQLGLFKVNHTPTDDDDPNFYNGAGVEADFPGYARVTVGPWPTPSEDETNKLWFTTAPPVRFCRSITGACETIYGVFAADPATGYWVFADLTWPTGLLFCTACDCVNVTVTITDQDVAPGH